MKKLLLLITMLMFSFGVNAGSYQEDCFFGCQGEPGMDGADGQDGMDGADGVNGYNGSDGSDGSFNNASNVIASMGAMANIPALNNHGGDSGIGMGVGSYGSNQALALGYIQQMSDNMNFKFSAARGIGSGTRGSNLVLGAGATFSW